MNKLLALLFLIGLLTGCADLHSNGTYSLKSPNQSVQLEFRILGGNATYSVWKDDNLILKKSRLGLRLADSEDLLNDFEVVETSRRAFDEYWKPLWGQESEIRNQYEELSVRLQQKNSGKKLDILFRAFDDGVAFRYSIPEQDNLSQVNILSEETSFAFSDNAQAWYQPIDTLTDTWEHGFDTYERLYKNSDIKSISTLVHTPATFILEGGTHLSIHEADLTDYSSMTLELDAMNMEFESHLVPWPDGIKVKTTAPMKSPWRTIQIGSDAGELAASRMTLNLNAPSVITPSDWIKPMKYVGVWWEMHMAKSTWEFGPKHGATTDNTKRYIDFAAENGLGGVLVEGWNLGWEDWLTNPNFDFTQAYPDYDLPYLVEYARSKGVEIIAHHETAGDIESYEEQLEDAFRLLNQLGIKAVKTGYVGPIRSQPKGLHHHGQFMVNHYRKVLETAAKYNVCVVAHEPIKPTGISRTYPNMLSREAMRGMEYNAWSDGNPPSHATILPFTMGLAGPLDYTPGIFKLDFDEYRKGNSTHTTLANQLAMYVTLYSPVQMAADFPEHYKGNPAFDFIKNVPTDWARSIVLDAQIGQYVVTARQCKSSGDWFVGAVNNEEARELEIDLSFLEGNLYRAQIYADADNISYEFNADSVLINELEITRESVLNLSLAPGGGQAIRLSNITPKTEYAGMAN